MFKIARIVIALDSHTLEKQESLVSRSGREVVKFPFLLSCGSSSMLLFLPTSQALSITSLRSCSSTRLGVALQTVLPGEGHTTPP